jgi:DNA primase
MNSIQAKKLSTEGYLASIGNFPKKVKNNVAWHCLRDEKTPSLKVDLSLNIWYDFGIGKGGNILDLVMLVNNTNITGALLILQKPELSKYTFSFSEQQSSNTANIKIKHLQPLQNRALIEYLNSRKISQAKAVNFVQEAYYSVNGKQYFALAFKNDRGGFELRNKYFKGSSSPKAVTTISGHKQAVNIFEGFIDFLSALEHYHTTKPTGSCIVLNSVSNLETIINSLEQYQQINLYLDNDNAGNQAAETIKDTHPKVKDYAKIIYPDHKDINEFLTAGNPAQIK